jgi:hypothetical protein
VRRILLGIPLLLIFPLTLLVLGMGNASIEAAQATCDTQSSFRIGTLNWRGASHYQTNPYPGERPYRERMPTMVSKISASGASIIGFQEFEPPQAEAFLRATNATWGVVKGRASNGEPATANSIAYQPSQWKVEEVRYVSIRYGRPTIQVPLARFTSLVGLGSIWVLNTHHPAQSVGGTEAMRNQAVAAEAEVLQKLLADEPNTPLFFTGDMNDQARFKQLFLALAPGWSTANPRENQIDWIMGSPQVTFSGAVVDHSTNDKARNYTDHPFVHASVQLANRGVGDAPFTALPRAATTPAISAGTKASTLEKAKVAASAGYQAGFRGADLVTLVAIAGVESSWNPEASNGTHFGLWQISQQHQGKVTGWDTQQDIFEPLLNARYAFALYSARPGSGEAKFADWIPFEKSDYRQFLDTARQAVAATGSGITPATCPTSTPQLAGELSAAVEARINAMISTPTGLCSLPWTRGAPCTYNDQCPKVVDAVYGGPGTGRGYGNGQDVAQGIINAGLAQAHGTGLNPLPPVGAVISYNRGDGLGHVAVYVGNGQIFGNGYGCVPNGIYNCVGFADIHTPRGVVTWALPKPSFDLGSGPATAA